MKNKVFNANLYARHYPDVALSGLSPRAHYERYGRLLGRDPAPRPVSGQPVESISHDDPAFLDRLYAIGPIESDSPAVHEELVSIIIPSYNNEGLIARAIHSALSQDGVDVEILVIDDGSTDGSVSVARRISETWSQVQVISLLRNFGCYYARNIGLMNAKGDYLTIIDSDDIMPPDRILRQMDALKKNPQAMACRGQQRRWSADYREALSELKPGENSLLWKREVLVGKGWYDTVRYSGDIEFRYRIQRNFGLDAIITMPDELYYTRTLGDSLTTNKKSGVYAFQDGVLETRISAPRRLYDDNFTAWQKQNKPPKDGMKGDIHIGFPLSKRPFALGEPQQNASPSLGQRMVGAMASFPARREVLQSSIASILPQLDELVLYLNDYDDVPDFARHPKIRVTRSQDAAGDLRDNGKFHDLPQGDDAYIFTLDDDLIYPPDYVARMVHAIEMLGRSSVVGVHGVIFPEGEFNDLAQRTVFTFYRKANGHFVDLLGTGTTAWHSSTLKVGLKDFQTKGVCDLWFAVAAARAGVPFYSLPREDQWLKENARFEVSLWNEARKRPEKYFGTYHAHLGPELEKGLVRCRMEAHLARGFDADTLAAAGIDLVSIKTGNTPVPLTTRRQVAFKGLPDPRPDVRADGSVHFHIVVNGWNCRDYVPACLRSIATQQPGNYTYETTLVDDGSDDGTYERLAASAILPDARLIRVRANMGPAHARHVGIVDIPDPNTVVVLVDMDDSLEPQALRVVAERYAANPACLMTIGNWHDQNGKRNPQDFYSAPEIDGQTLRDVELFNATHLRTFRRVLYDAITPEDLLDQHGKWIETCTDVALMYPLLDQCWSNEVEFISEPIYRYNRQHSTGTLARFGKPHKVERLAWLKAKPKKPRLNPRQDQRN
ncbi:glycosyltransferase [Paracoccus sp. 22332]|uniref:glycosyltransferase n=1 Tax=Paracoccus sp. 22332 TaxID=3453913 RepID=UPI003F8375E6